MKQMKHWRAVTWALVAWTPAWLVIGWWLLADSAAAGRSENNANALLGFVIAPAWFWGLVILGVVWRRSRPRVPRRPD